MRAVDWLCLILVGFSIAGCSHYYLPSNRLETPEALGDGRVGRIHLLGVQSGANLTATALPQSPDPLTGVTPAPLMQTSLFQPFLGFEFGLADMWDMGIRLQPYGPLSFRVRAQWVGEPEARATSGFSLGTSMTVGALIGRVGQDSVFLYQWDVALPLGYRFGKAHVFTLFPFLGIGGLSGAYNTSVVQYGGGLGHHWEFGAIVLRTEIVYALGSAGTDRISVLNIGATLGFQL